MIKFFRHIRYKLMEKGDTGKYFKYAIGEILLVVIGILIALQINNWNEARKTMAKEVEILKDFQNGLEFDIYQMDSILAHYARAKVSINKILDHMETDQPLNDSLVSHFFNTTLVYDSGGLTAGVFETLKSAGFDLISEKDIRDLIITVYDEHHPWLLKWEQRYIDLIFGAQERIYSVRFEDFWNGDYKEPSVVGKMIPLDYESLKTDEEFKHLLRTQINLIGWLINKPVESTKVECNKLLKLIEKELDSVDK